MAKRRIRSKIRRGLQLAGETGLGEIIVRTPVDTGNLRSSYNYQLIEDETNPGVVWGTNVEYAPYVDLGTYKMAPRPHFKQTIQSNVGKLREVMAKGMKQ